jgi:hypothetical protein
MGERAVIERVVIRQFQNHRRLELILDPHWSVLVGDSDAGKSAALRALHWLMLNQPAGEAFLGQWGKADYVSVLGVVDGRRVYRRRGGGPNLYKLDGKILEAFGKGGVPQEVERLLNVGEVNFQHQIDRPFWMTLTPGNLSKELNSIINLSAIDATLEAANQSVRSARATVSMTTERLATSKARKARLRWAVGRDRLVSAAEGASRRLDAHRQRRICLRQGVQTLAVVARRHKQLSRALARGLIAIQLADELLSANNKAANLAQQLQAIHQLNQVVKIADPDPQDLQRCEELRLQRRELDALTLSISELTYQEQQAEAFLISSINDLKKLTRGKCPICGNNLKLKP